MTLPDADAEVLAASGQDGGRRSFAANAFWMVAGQGAAKVAAFAFVLVVTRGLDARAYGYFHFAASFVPLFLIVASWGLDVALIREVARQPSRFSELLSSALVLRVVMGVTAVAVSLVLGVLLTTSGDGRTILVLVATALFVDELTNLVGAAFKAFERMAFLAVALVVNRIATTVLALLAVAGGGDIVVVSVMYLFGSVAALVTAAVAARRLFPPVHVRDASRATVRELLHHGAPLGVAAVLNMALLRVDAVLLQHFDGAVAVGEYGVAYRFLDSFLFVAYALGVVAMPRIARSGWGRDGEDSFNNALFLILAFYVPLGVSGWLLGRWAVTALFSEQYSQAGDAVRWLAAAGGFYAVAYLCRVSAVALGRRRHIAVVAAIVLTANVAANAIAIPRYGYRGAAVVTFFSEVVEALLLATVLWRAAPVRIRRVAAAPVAAGLVMAATIALAGPDTTAGALAGVAAYVAVLVVAALGLAPQFVRGFPAARRAR